MTFTEYDANNRVTKVTSGYGTSSPRVERVVTYTDNSKEKTLADGKGHLATNTYDAFDRLTKVNYPNASRRRQLDRRLRRVWLRRLR